MTMHTLDTDLQWEELLDVSNTSSVIVLKHSITCPVSARAHAEVEEYLRRYTGDIPVYRLVVQHSPELKLRIAKDLDLEHESPQLIIISNKQSVLHMNHGAITATAIHDALQTLSEL